ncbi:MAG TPA: cobalamin biosynthesis protein CobD [Bacillus bacterium]|nr:cobalamin biosynthesis protein CobD [Bacillus sp. (in: firmicutes)]
MLHTIAAWLALFLDKGLGDPRWLPHPVRGFGYVIKKLDHYLNRGNFRKGKGLLAWLIIAVIVFFPAFYFVQLVRQINEIAAIVVEAIFIYTTIAEKDLARAGMAVAVPLREGNLPPAREMVGWIVGRDTDKMDESEVVRATVETIAENTSDGITAPLFWAFLGGAPLALLYRVVNTCDSMLGYKNERYGEFGWASAKIDDLFNLIPSRITGFVMIFSNILFSKSSLSDCLCILLRDAKKHPSPNSGWCEAAMAGLLEIQLGGRNTYKGVVSERARMGEPIHRLAVFHIDEAIVTMKRTVFALMVLFTVGVIFLSF